MADRINNIPSVNTRGPFQANPPFDKVVDPSTYYNTEAIRTIGEMQTNNQDLNKLIFTPAGISNDESVVLIEQIKSDRAVIVALSDTNGNWVYIPSTYIKTLPLTDGVIQEHLCIYSDLGVVNPTLKDRIGVSIDHINNYIKTNIGVDANTRIGYIPQKGFISKQQADAWEASRQLKIKDSKSDLELLETYKKENQELKIYITSLEEDLKKK